MKGPSVLNSLPMAGDHLLQIKDSLWEEWSTIKLVPTVAISWDFSYCFDTGGDSEAAPVLWSSSEWQRDGLWDLLCGKSSTVTSLTYTEVTFWTLNSDFLRWMYEATLITTLFFFVLVFLMVHRMMKGWVQFYNFQSDFAQMHLATGLMQG